MAFDLKSIQASIKKNDTNNSSTLDAILKKEIHLFGSSFSNKKKEAFYLELSVLLNAGITLKNTLGLLSEDQKKKKDRELLNIIIDKLVFGKTFSEAIHSLKEFTEYEYFSLKIGEETGNLEKVCQELGTFYQRKNQQRRTLLNALLYPIVVLITALMAVVFMLRFVVPMFVDIFKQNKIELPWITKIIISASEQLNAHLWSLLFGLAAVMVLQRVISKKIWYQRIISTLKLKTPYFGNLIRKVYLAQYTQATTLLLNSKVSLLNCITFTKRMIPFYPLQSALSSIENDIVKGTIFSDALAKHSIFDKKMVSLVKVAEQTNQTTYIFEKLTTQYNEDIQQQSKLLSTILEPIIIIFLGVFVGVILVSMYLPMFKLSTAIG